MITIDRRTVNAPLATVFETARNVERWPEWLPHYRWVRFHERRDGGGVVEMAAFRPFGLFSWPTWWVSEMSVEESAPRIRFRHVRGITRGMDVAWDFAAGPGGVEVVITHVWEGPRWPLVGRLAANLVIGPVFIHGIASRTLAGIARRAEAIQSRTGGADGRGPEAG
jgi:ribosome-associated toxin RatA of RatAB toxin-antitoxin module